MTRADAGDMRTAVLRVLAAAAVVLGLVSGCTAAPSPQPSSPAQSEQNRAGLRDVRPCPGIAGFRCGSLSVRLDPFGSVPGRLSLRVAVSGVASAPRCVLRFLTGGTRDLAVPCLPRS